ncbi:cytochrome P450, partial [Mycena floridula]
MTFTDQLVVFLDSAANLPPGPPGYPIVGNAFQVPSSGSHWTYTEWANRYGLPGPIVHFTLFGKDVILLNTLAAASDLVDKRSFNYSDRPQQVMCGSAGIARLALAPSGPTHRAHRKLINGNIRLWSVQQASAQHFVKDIFSAYPGDSGKRPSDHQFLEILASRVSKSVAGIVFGEPAVDGGSGMTREEMDKYIRDADAAQALFTKTSVPFSYLVDSVPWLRHIPDYFPFASFKKEAKRGRLELEALTMEPYLKTRDRIMSGVSQSSYIDACLSTNPDPTREQEESIAWTGYVIFDLNSSQTITTMTTILLLAALNPEAQSLVHRELINVVGTDRMPCLDDQLEAKYTTAFVQECVPHQALETDTYANYTIPKGATIITHIWAMMHDPNVYTSPDTFDPARFLPLDGISSIPGVSSPGRNEPGIANLPFGFGRRICPGMHLANSGVWIYTACFLWAFEISLDEGPGRSIMISSFSKGSLGVCPLPFKANIRVRSQAVEALLRN